MQDPVLVDLLSYWENLRAGRLAPTRSELDPRQFTAALDHAFILQRRAPGDISFRLSGQALNLMMGMELRSMPARSVIDLASREDFDGILEDLFADPKVVALRLSNDTSRPELCTGRMLLLPLQCDDGSISRILGCMVVSGPGKFLPGRFRITGSSATPIATGKIATGKSAAPAIGGFADAARPFRPRGAGQLARTRRLSAERPYLRLVRDDD